MVACDFKRDICAIPKQQVDVMNFFRYHAKLFKPMIRWSVYCKNAKRLFHMVCKDEFSLWVARNISERKQEWDLMFSVRTESDQETFGPKQLESENVHTSIFKYEVTKHGLWDKFYHQGYEDRYLHWSFCTDFVFFAETDCFFCKNYLALIILFFLQKNLACLYFHLCGGGGSRVAVAPLNPTKVTSSIMICTIRKTAFAI